MHLESGKDHPNCQGCQRSRSVGSGQHAPRGRIALTKLSRLPMLRKQGESMQLSGPHCGAHTVSWSPAPSHLSGRLWASSSASASNRRRWGHSELAAHRQPVGVPKVMLLHKQLLRGVAACSAGSCSPDLHCLAGARHLRAMGKATRCCDLTEPPALTSRDVILVKWWEPTFADSLHPALN